MLANALKIACFGVFSRGKWVVCANIVRYSIDRGYVHFFVSRQRNGTKENALRGSAPKYPVGLCAFCSYGTKIISTVAPLQPQNSHNLASLAVSAQGDDMMPFRHQDKLDGFGAAETF